MKRVMSLVVCLSLLLSAAAFAQVATKNRYTMDMGADGQEETVLLDYYLNDDLNPVSEEISLQVRDAAETVLLDNLLLNLSWTTEAPLDWTVRLAALGEDVFYVETTVSLDGTEVNYLVYRWNGAGFDLEKSLTNPGYTDGEALFDNSGDGLTTDVLYQKIADEEPTGKYDSMLFALNSELVNYGVYFTGLFAEIPEQNVVGELSSDDFADKRPVAGEVQFDFTQPKAKAETETEAAPAAAAAPLQGASAKSNDADYVQATGDVNLRKSPSLDGKRVDVLYKGESLPSLGKTAVDERGVAWYKVNYKGQECWCSSTYSKLVYGKPAPAPTSSGTKSASKLTLDNGATVKQSSYVKDNNPKVDGTKAFDGKKSTAWNVSDYGYGDWVSITGSGKYKAKGFTIYNGYNKTKDGRDYWERNCRVAQLSVYCDGKFVESFWLYDMRDQQTCAFTTPVTGSSFKFVIDDVYYGDMYSDVAISEISLY